MARFSCNLVVVLTTILPLIKACGYPYNKVLQPWLPIPAITCSFLCPLTQTETWSDARDLCFKDKSDLTTVNNQRELNNLIANNRPGIWIGLKDLDKNGSFTYSDGSDDGFISWAPGFPTADPNKTCVVVKQNGMENDDCDAKYNYLCERGLCQEYGGTCVNRATRCCKNRIIDDIQECSGDPAMICCKPGSPGRGGGLVTDTVICPSAHQECLCQIESEYILAGSQVAPFTPAFHIINGCETGLPLKRQPVCGDPNEACLRQRILNLLKCYNHTCNEQLSITSLLDSNSYPDGKDFCNGKCVRVIRPASCPSAPLEQMCCDIRGTFYEEVDANNEIYATCCF